MPSFSLDLVSFVPGELTTPGQAQVDAANHRVVLAQDDIPVDGGTLEITVLTVFVRGSATDTAKAAQIADAELNSSNGIIELLIRDESIIDRGSAINRAVSELRMKSQQSISVTFTTRQDGWDVGQVFRFVDSRATPPIDVLLTVQQLTQKFIQTTNLIDEFEYNITAAPFIIDPDTNLSRLIERFYNPVKARLALIETE